MGGSLLGVRNLVVALSLSLVVITAVIIGALTIATYERSLDDTKRAWSSGLDQSQAAGGQNVELMVSEAMGKTMDYLAADMVRYLSKPRQHIETLVRFIQGHTLEDLVNPQWWNHTLTPIMSQMFHTTAPDGVMTMWSMNKGLSCWYAERQIGCDGDLHSLIPESFPEGSLVKDSCPKNCGVCVPAPKTPAPEGAACADDPAMDDTPMPCSKMTDSLCNLDISKYEADLAPGTLLSSKCQCSCNLCDCGPDIPPVTIGDGYMYAKKQLTVGTQTAASVQGAGRVMYEVDFERPPAGARVGWSDAGGGGAEVGDDASGWAVDYELDRRFHAGDAESIFWKPPTVWTTLGVAADVGTGEMWVGQNGVWHAVFGAAPFPPGIVPAVSVDGALFRLNTVGPFRHAPPIAGAGFVPFGAAAGNASVAVLRGSSADLVGAGGEAPGEEVVCQDRWEHLRKALPGTDMVGGDVLTVAFAENPNTATLPPEAFHDYIVINNFKQNRKFMSDFGNPGKLGHQRDPDRSCDPNRAQATDGAESVGGCTIQTPPAEKGNNFNAALYLEEGWIRPGQARWVGLRPRESMLTMGVLANYEFPDLYQLPNRGRVLGYVQAATDVIAVSHFLVRTAGETGTLPQGSRLYAVERHPRTYTTVFLVGTSHGRAYELADSVEGSVMEQLGKEEDLPKLLLPAIDAGDPVIRAHARHVLGTETVVGQRGALASGGGAGAETNEQKAQQEEQTKAMFSHPVAPAPGTEGFERFDPSVMHDWHDADGALYWVKIRNVTDDPSCDPRKEYGCLCIWLTLLVPRDSAMRTIDKSVARVNAMISDETKKTEDDQQTNFTVTMVVIVVVAVLLMVIAIVFAHFITAPLATLQRSMAKVATLSLDDVDTTQMSRLSEVRSMQKSFRRMVLNITELRNYMPQSVLADAAPEDDEEEKASGTKQSLSQRVSTQQHTKASRTLGGSSVGTSRSAAAKAFLQRVAGDGLRNKKLSVAATNVVGWHRATAGQGGAAVLAMHGEMLEGALAAASAVRGIPDTFSGDRLVVSFNAVNAVASHRSSACVFLNAYLAAAAQKHMASSGRGGAPGASAMGISAAATTGQGQCGNAGCPGMKKHTVFSPVVTLAHAGAKLSQHVGIKCGVDGWLHEEAKTKFYFRKSVQVNFPKRAQAAFNWWELREAIKVGEDEWMYQLEEGASADPYKHWNTAAEACIAGNWEEAVSNLEQYQVTPEAKEDPATSWLTVAIAEKQKVQPTLIGFH